VSENHKQNNYSALLKSTVAMMHDLATPVASAALNIQTLLELTPAIIETYKEQHLNEIDKQEDAERLKRVINSLELNILSIQALSNDHRKLIQVNPLPDFSSLNVSGQDTENLMIEEFQLAAGSRKILLVEDEEIHRDIACKQLCPHYTVDLASSASEALSKHETNEYNIVLMDLILKSECGLETARALRKTLSEETVFIGISNLPITLEGQSDMESIFEGFMTKPFQLSRFESILSKIQPPTNGK